MDERLFERADATIATTRDIVQSLQRVRGDAARIAARRRILRRELQETIEARRVRSDLVALTIDLQIVLDQLHRSACLLHNPSV